MPHGLAYVRTVDSPTRPAGSSLTYPSLLLCPLAVHVAERSTTSEQARDENASEGSEAEIKRKRKQRSSERLEWGAKIEEQTPDRRTLGTDGVERWREYGKS